jgi:hypothetical protein
MTLPRGSNYSFLLFSIIFKGCQKTICQKISDKKLVLIAKKLASKDGWFSQNRLCQFPDMR